MSEVQFEAQFDSVAAWFELAQHHIVLMKRTVSSLCWLPISHR